ncbi:MAG: hypothetical protein H3Z50_06420 [archaeon]|nr:hypothetical protein [archaeon]MCP8306552.1 hypothetical protein [archaeon]
MKFIAFWEFKPEDFDKVIEKYKQAMAEREKGSEKFPKFLFPPHSMGGEWKGFAIYENATPEQLTNVALFFAPEEKVKFVPIFDSAKAVELYMKMKK